MGKKAIKEKKEEKGNQNKGSTCGGGGKTFQQTEDSKKLALVPRKENHTLALQ